MKAIHTFACCALLLTASAASAQTIESLAAIENQYVAAFQLHEEQGHLAKVAALDAQYLQALDKAFKAATKGGQLKEAVALRDEMERVNGKQPLPEKDEGMEGALLKLRSAYRGQLAKLMAERAQAAAPIVKKFDDALLAYQTALTKAGKLDEAKAVLAYREAGVSAKLLGETGSIVAEGPNNSVEKAQLAALNRSKSGEIAAWALKIGGKVGLAGRQDLIDSAEKLPASNDIEIERLSLWSMPDSSEKVTSNDLRSLKDLRSLRQLELRGNPIGDKGAAILGMMPGLTSLNVHDCELTDAAMRHLAKLTSLEELDLGYSHGKITDAGAASLASLTRLKRLNIYASSITDKTLQILATLPALEYVEMHVTKVSAEGVAAFQAQKPGCRVKFR